MKKSLIISILLAVAVMMLTMIASAESMDLDHLIEDIETEELLNGDIAKRFVHTLALVPKDTELYADEALTLPLATLRAETRAFVVDRIKADKPEEDVLLLAIAVEDRIELMWTLHGEAVELTPDEANAAGDGVRVPGTLVWLTPADLVMAELPQPDETETQPVTDLPAEEDLQPLTTREEEKKDIVLTSSVEGLTSVPAGTEVTLTAHVTGYDLSNYRLQWQYSPDGGATVHDVADATGLEMTFTLDEVNKDYFWRILVIPLESYNAGLDRTR